MLNRKITCRLGKFCSEGGRSIAAVLLSGLLVGCAGERLASRDGACAAALDQVAPGVATFDGVTLSARPYAAFAARRSADGKTAFVAVDDGSWPVDPEYRFRVDGRPRRVEALFPSGRWKEVGFDYSDEKNVVLFRHPAPTAVACARLSLKTPAERPAFTGEDSPAIERMIAQAVNDGSRRVTLAKKPDGTPWYLTRAILLPDDFTLEIDDCTVQLAPFVKDNLIRNAGAQETGVTPNRNIAIRGRGRAVLCGGLENHYAPRRSGDTNGWRALGVILSAVDGFVIDGVTLRETQAWGVSIENGSCHGRVSNIRLEDTNLLFNQDGIDVRAGCHDIVIENISGSCGDDAVALTGVGSRGQPLAAKLSGGKIVAPPLSIGSPRCGRDVCEADDIYNVTISNVHARSAGGHSVVRLLCQDGVKLHHVTVRDVVDTTEDGQLEAQATIRIGDFDYWTDRPAQMGDMHHIVIEDVKARGKFGISFKGPLSDSVIRNVTVRPKTPAYDVRAPFRNVLFDSH